jgi:cbb3-type cytochrome oxidase subunit 3
METGGVKMGAKRKVSLAWVVMACLIVTGLLGGCSSSQSSKEATTSSSNDLKAVQPSNATADQFEKNASSAVAATKSDTAPSAVAAAETKPASSAVPNAVIPANGNDQEAGFNRKLIYKANLVMPVEDYSKAQTALRDLVALSGAYILQFSENANTGEKGGTYTIKVAANGFVSMLDGLEKLSPAIQRNVQGQDVTEEYVDLSSRLTAKQLVETRLLSFMEKASKTDDLLAFSNELAKVQEAIEQIKGRIRYLDQNVSYSTIEIRMYQQTGKKPLLSDPNELTLSERVEKAWGSSLNVLVAVLQGVLVFLAAAVPVLLILLLIAVPIWVYRRKRNSQLKELRLQLKEQNASERALEDAEQGAKGTD